MLLKDSGVVLERAAAANLPGSRQTAYFTGRGADALRGLANNADAVIGLRSIWADDPLYPNARRSNIRIVEIDAARPVVQPGQGTDGLNSQPWLASNNMGRMADVLAADLVRLAPAAKPKIEANLAAFKQHLLKLSASSETALASADNLSVVSLSDRFGYLISGLNLELIDSQILTDEQWTPEALGKLSATLKDNDVALVLDHREPPEPVKAAMRRSASHDRPTRQSGRLRFHLLAQAQGAHVGPDFFDVGQALFLEAAFADGAPAVGDGFVVGPDRILFFVVDHNLKDDVFPIEY